MVHKSIYIILICSLVEVVWVAKISFFFSVLVEFKERYDSNEEKKDSIITITVEAAAASSSAADESISQTVISFKK